MYVCIYIYIHIYIHTCICMYTYIHTYIYICIYIHTVFVRARVCVWAVYIYGVYHPRMANDRGIFTTTVRIIFYNRWRQSFAKVQMNYSEFHQWLVHLNNSHSGLYCPYSLVPDPQNFLNFQKLQAYIRRQEFATREREKQQLGPRRFNSTCAWGVKVLVYEALSYECMRR